jgi:hypothetical protein
MLYHNGINFPPKMVFDFAITTDVDPLETAVID